MAIVLKTVSDSKQAQEDLAKLRKSVDGIKTSTENITKSFGNFAKATAGLAISAGVFGSYTKYSDKISNIQSRLKVAAKDQDDFNFSMKQVQRIAKESRSDLESVSKLYQRTALAVKDIGIGQRDIAKFTELVSKAVKTSGADAQNSAFAIQQLGQALGSNRLGGDELRSILENSAGLAIAIADGLGVSVGQLREMGEQGQLVASNVFNAILSQENAINKNLAKMGVTYADAFNSVSLGVDLLFSKISKLAQGSGFSLAKLIKSFGDALFDFADNFEIKINIIGLDIAIFISNTQSLFEDLGNTVLTVLGTITTAFLTSFNKAKSSIGGFANISKKSLKDLLAFLKQFLINIKDSFGKIDFTKSFSNNFKQIFENVQNFFKNFYAKISKYIPNIDFSKLFSSFLTLKTKFKENELGNKVYNSIKDAFFKLKDSLKGLLSKISIDIEFYFKKASNFIKNNFKGILEKLPEISVEKIFKGLESALNTVKIWAKEVNYWFWWVYDKVIGRSWIPDLVLGVKEWFLKLLGTPVTIIKKFGTIVSTIFKGFGIFTFIGSFISFVSKLVGTVLKIAGIVTVITTAIVGFLSALALYQKFTEQGERKPSLLRQAVEILPEKAQLPTVGVFTGIISLAIAAAFQGTARTVILSLFTTAALIFAATLPNGLEKIHTFFEDIAYNFINIVGTGFNKIFGNNVLERPIDFLSVLAKTSLLFEKGREFWGQIAIGAITSPNRFANQLGRIANKGLVNKELISVQKKLQELPVRLKQTVRANSRDYINNLKAISNATDASGNRIGRRAAIDAVRNNTSLGSRDLDLLVQKARLASETFQESSDNLKNINNKDPNKRPEEERQLRSDIKDLKETENTLETQIKEAKNAFLQGIRDTTSAIGGILGGVAGTQIGINIAKGMTDSPSWQKLAVILGSGIVGQFLGSGIGVTIGYLLTGSLNFFIGNLYKWGAGFLARIGIIFSSFNPWIKGALILTAALYLGYKLFQNLPDEWKKKLGFQTDTQESEIQKATSQYNTNKTSENLENLATTIYENRGGFRRGFSGQDVSKQSSFKQIISAITPGRTEANAISRAFEAFSVDATLFEKFKLYWAIRQKEEEEFDKIREKSYLESLNKEEQAAYLENKQRREAQIKRETEYLDNYIFKPIKDLGNKFVEALTASSNSESLPFVGSPYGPPQKRATGGWITGPGGPKDDKIPAMLSNGEFVINAKAAAKNKELLYAINSGKNTEFFADGKVDTPLLPLKSNITNTRVIPTINDITSRFTDFKNPNFPKLIDVNIKSAEPTFYNLISNTIGSISEDPFFKGIVTTITDFGNQLDKVTGGMLPDEFKPETNSATSANTNTFQKILESNLSKNAALEQFAKGLNEAGYKGINAEGLSGLTGANLQAVAEGLDKLAEARANPNFNKDNIAGQMLRYNYRNLAKAVEEGLRSANVKFSTNTFTGASAVVRPSDLQFGQQTSILNSMFSDLNLSDRSFQRIADRTREDIMNKVIGIQQAYDTMNQTLLTFADNGNLNPNDFKEAFDKYYQDLIRVRAEIETPLSKVRGEFENVQGRLSAIGINADSTSFNNLSKSQRDKVRELATAPSTLKDREILADTTSVFSPEEKAAAQKRLNSIVKQIEIILKEGFNSSLTGFDKVINEFSNIGISIDKSTLNRMTDTQLKDIQTLRDSIAKAQAKLENGISDSVERINTQRFVDKAMIALDAKIQSASQSLAEKAGESFASSIQNTVYSTISEVFKDPQDVKEKLENMLLSFSHTVIDTFTQGLLDPIIGESSPLMTGLKDLGSSIFSTGESAGNMVVDNPVVQAMGAAVDRFGQWVTQLQAGVPGVPGAAGGGTAGNPVDPLQQAIQGTGQQQIDSQEKTTESLGSRITSTLFGTTERTIASLTGIAGLLTIMATSVGGKAKMDWVGVALGAASLAVSAYSAFKSPNSFLNKSGVTGASGYSTNSGASLTGGTLDLFQRVGAKGGLFTFATGGNVQKFPNGLLSGPGTGTSDSIRALLSNGEFVINAASTKKFLPLLEEINATKYASGGLVGSSLLTTPVPMYNPNENSTNLNTKTEQIFNINITGDVSRQTRSEIQRMIPNIASGVNSHNREKGKR